MQSRNFPPSSTFCDRSSLATLHNKMPIEGTDLASSLQPFPPSPSPFTVIFLSETSCLWAFESNMPDFIDQWMWRTVGRAVNTVARTSNDQSREVRGRDVYIIHWGKKLNGSISFHYALLVADVPYGANTHQPSRTTTGTTFSWGSMETGKLIKTGGLTKTKPFNFSFGADLGNTYTYVCCTTLSDPIIAKTSKTPLVHSAQSLRKNNSILGNTK